MIRIIYTTFGVLALVLAIIGIFLPLLPTTPFLLLAAFCFMRGSRRMHRWLISHPIMGPYINDFQAGHGIPLRTKCLALTIMWLSLGFSAWLVPLVWVRYVLAIIGLGVTIYLIRIPTRKIRSV